MLVLVVLRLVVLEDVTVEETVVVGDVVEVEVRDEVGEEVSVVVELVVKDDVGVDVRVVISQPANVPSACDISILLSTPAISLHSFLSVIPPRRSPPAAQASVPVLVERVYSVIPSFRALVVCSQSGDVPGTAANTIADPPSASGTGSQLSSP